MHDGINLLSAAAEKAGMSPATVQKATEAVANVFARNHDVHEVSEIKNLFLQKTHVVANVPPSNWQSLYGTKPGTVELKREEYDQFLLRVPHPADLSDAAQVTQFRAAIVERHLANIFSPRGKDKLVTGNPLNLYETLSQITAGGDKQFQAIDDVTKATNTALQQSGSPLLNSKASWFSMSSIQKDALVKQIAQSNHPIHELTKFERENLFKNYEPHDYLPLAFSKP